MKILLFIILFIAGCASTTKEDVEIVKLQTQQQQQIMQFHQALASKPTYKINCDAGCAFEIYDGDELPPLPQVDHFVSANEANARMFEAGMKIIPTVSGYAAGAKILSDAFDAAGGGNSTIHNTSTISGDDNTLSATAEMGGATKSSSVIGDAISTDNSIVDNSAVNDNRIDSTSTPTIVTQPQPITNNPVIVNPVVVDKQIPVIVQPSYPPIQN